MFLNISLVLLFFSLSCSELAIASCGFHTGHCYYYKKGKLVSQSSCKVTGCGNMHGNLEAFEWDNGKMVIVTLGDDGNGYSPSCYPNACGQESGSNGCISVFQNSKKLVNCKPAYIVNKGNKIYCYGIGKKKIELFCSDHIQQRW